MVSEFYIPINLTSKTSSVNGLILNSQNVSLTNWLVAYNLNPNITKTLRASYATLAILTRLWVLDKYRARGIGTDLLKNFITLAQHHGADALLLLVDLHENNKFDLLQWYIKHGFSVLAHSDDVEDNPLVLLNLR